MRGARIAFPRPRVCIFRVCARGVRVGLARQGATRSGGDLSFLHPAKQDLSEPPERQHPLLCPATPREAGSNAPVDGFDLGMPFLKTSP
jgi:hypothetical protein